MPLHPALASGRAAVITGAASGIGLAAATRFAELGMKICLADVDAIALERASETVIKLARDKNDVIFVPTDVSKLSDIIRLNEHAYEAFGEVAVLMNNAGTEGGGTLFGQTARWREILDVNLWGVIHGTQTFVPAMQAQGTPCAVINTGSKQGITCPPGDTAYNVSKAGIKVVTEALAHELRGMKDCKVTAHLLIPGFTFTGFTRRHTQTKPDAAWLPEQVVEFMIEAMTRDDFYILCPDNSVTRKVDELRMQWAVGDIVENRPPLSRWHEDFQAKFADFLETGLRANNQQ